jgi:copper chaperone CopZ
MRSDALSKAPQTAALGAAFLTALGASSCCLGPVLLSALGFGGLGVFGWVGPFRPYVLGVTAALVVGAFYPAYRRPKADRPGGCGCEPSPSNRRQKIVLWVSTFAIALLALAPSLLARAGARQHDVSSPTSAVTAVVHVDGMDCEACAAPMRRELAKVGGFRRLDLDLKNHTVTISYQPGADRPAAYIKAINALGYGAILATAGKE